MLKQLAKMTIAVKAAVFCALLVVLISAHHEPNDALCCSACKSHVITDCKLAIVRTCT